MTPEEEREFSETASIRTRGVLLAKSVWRNVRFVHELPNANLMGKPLAGETVIVCGAGPSLNQHYELLREAQDHVRIFAVNTAAHALAKNGVRPHVCVAVESVNVGNHLPDGVPVLAALASHETIWNRASWWTTEASAAMCRLCMHWGTWPTTIGIGAALGTAVEQALAWGATTIVLVGCDLSVENGCKVYADGAPDAHAAITAAITHVSEEFGERVVLRNHEAREEAFRAAGVAAPSAMRSQPHEVPAWHGGVVYSPIEFKAQIDYLEARAKSLRGGRRIINATEGGARIEGTEKATLSAALNHLLDWHRPYVRHSALVTPVGEREAQHVSPERRDAAIADVLEQCKRAYAYTEKMGTGGFCPAPEQHFFPAVYELAYPGLLGVDSRVKHAKQVGATLPDAVALGAFNQALRGAAAQLAMYITTGRWERTDDDGTTGSETREALEAG